MTELGKVVCRIGLGGDKIRCSILDMFSLKELLDTQVEIVDRQLETHV